MSEVTPDWDDDVPEVDDAEDLAAGVGDHGLNDGSTVDLPAETDRGLFDRPDPDATEDA